MSNVDELKLADTVLALKLQYKYDSNEERSENPLPSTRTYVPPSDGPLLGNTFSTA